VLLPPPHVPLHWDLLRRRGPEAIGLAYGCQATASAESVRLAGRDDVQGLSD
jgi:hypothetical protein